MAQKIYVPPIKIQGIKTKLIDIISDNVCLEKDSTWYEPFMGSGVVGLNLAPKKAFFSDTNPYVIALYNAIQSGEVNSHIVREFLEYEGAILKEKDEEHYYYIRDRFNEKHDPLDFLFLNRSCFNGMIRFNKNHKFNVPYCHKPERFSKSYITKIVNQVRHLEDIFHNNDWKFVCCSFEDTIAMAKENDFIYCDPPYIGRHVDYYDSWNETQEIALKNALYSSKAKFMISTWYKNQYRQNEYIDTIWNDCYKLYKEHFYHIGAKEVNRNSMTEALLVNYVPSDTKKIMNNVKK